MLRFLLLALLVAWGGWQWWMHRPVSPGPGVVAPMAPQQAGLDGAPAFTRAEYKITPLARFRVEARVLGVERYRLGREAGLAPVDLALGWGPMSDDRVLGGLAITQGNRFYYYSWKDMPPLPPTEIVAHSANMHMIPADMQVAKQLERVRIGQVVEFEGELVAVQASDGWRWRSSLSRTDTGNGACELVWVKSLRIR